MYSIGQIAKRTAVKIPTIRYYEQIGLIDNAGRNAGNQRRYDDHAVRQLQFIKHCRDMGFAPDAIRELLTLDGPCAVAHEIANRQLATVKLRIIQLQKLAKELARITALNDDGKAHDCRVLEALGAHENCASDHKVE